MSTRRMAKIDEVLAARLAHVRLAIEHVHHRHNTSAILRTADALGVQHVHLIGEQPLIIARGASRGASRWLDLHAHDDAASAICAIHEAGADIWVADLDGEARAPEELPLARPVCLWFGAEVVGVCAEAKAAARGVVCLPMHGFAQSLNVSVAAAIITHAVTSRARHELGERALLTPADRAVRHARWMEREHATRAEIQARLDVWREV